MVSVWSINNKFCFGRYGKALLSFKVKDFFLEIDNLCVFSFAGLSIKGLYFDRWQEKCANDCDIKIFELRNHSV